MDIEHIHLSGRGAFVIKGDGKRLAEMTYTITDGSMDINHTQVDESLRGQGIGEDLLESAVAYARQSKLKIEASCPYAAKLLARNADYADVFSG